ncbi:cardiolipin synthase [Muribaculaceae bacterium Isolate-002 (NCI)]|nr:cardiolipin synthase [Muribaculaceae bacterium Isolate-002 (NCI)]
MSETINQYINLTWVYWALWIVYGVTIISVVLVVLSENRNPVKSLAWITVLLLLPAVGLILYFLFGRSIKNKRFISRRNRRRLKKHEQAKAFNAAASGLSVENSQQVKLGQSLMGAPYYEYNKARIFDNGKEKFDILMQDLRRARRFIYLQYYIFEDDRIGNAIADILISKAKSGVKVKVIYDHLGNFKVKRKFYRRMREAGVEVYPFFKISLLHLGARINWRNHRKLCLIDGRVGYIGGMNVADRYIDGGKFGVWRDIHLRVTGPILRSFNHSFCYDWNFMGRPIPEDFTPVDAKASDGEIGMQLVTSGPTGQWGNISLMFLKAIGNAKKSIYLQTPYFLPTEGLLRALQAAALSKIDVRVMIPRRSDSAMLRHASFSYIKDCLRAGIKVYLYEPGMLHGKVIIVDDDFVTVGSTNFDFRSFEHNFEANLFVYSKDFNERMTDIFMRDLEESTRVLPYDWEHRPRIDKMKQSVMRLFSPIL